MRLSLMFAILLISACSQEAVTPPPTEAELTQQYVKAGLTETQAANLARAKLDGTFDRTDADRRRFAQREEQRSDDIAEVQRAACATDAATCR